MFYISTNRPNFGHSTNFKFAPISPAFLVRRSPKFISRIQTLGRFDSIQKNRKIPLHWKLPGRNPNVVFYIRRMPLYIKNIVRCLAKQLFIGQWVLRCIGYVWVRCESCWGYGESTGGLDEVQREIHEIRCVQNWYCQTPGGPQQSTISPKESPWNCKYSKKVLSTLSKRVRVNIGTSVTAHVMPSPCISPQTGY